MLLDDLIEEISPGLYRIGDLGVPIFLIDATSPVLIDSGYSFTGELYAEAVKKILGKRGPRWCLITHTHFDHVGAVGYFKKLFPEMQIAGSEIARQIVSKQKALDHIASLNHFAENLYLTDTPSCNTPFTPFQIETVLSENDILSIGESLHVSVIETPGHTKDSLSFFLNEHKTIFTGDSGGIFHESGYAFYDFLSGCAPYLHSLNKICNICPEIICQGHYNVIKGTESEKYIKELVPGCLKFIKLVSEILAKQNGDINSCMNIIKSLEYDVLSEPKQPEPAYLLNLEARIRSVFSYDFSANF